MSIKLAILSVLIMINEIIRTSVIIIISTAGIIVEGNLNFLMWPVARNAATIQAQSLILTTAPFGCQHVHQMDTIPRKGAQLCLLSVWAEWNQSKAHGTNARPFFKDTTD